MTEMDFSQQLGRIPSEHVLAEQIDSILDIWKSNAVGIEAIEPILRFMEAHPFWDFGSPGALVHFVERFYGGEYEKRLVESIERRPTFHTVWMLNGVIGVEKDQGRRKYFSEVMADARKNQQVDQSTLERIDHFLSLHSD